MPRYICEVCDLNLVNEHSFDEHLKGQRHLKNVNKQNIKLRSQQTSIFVAPLPPWASRDQILNVFQQYAPIEYYSFHNRSAIIKFSDRSTVDVLLRHPIYIKNWRLNIQERIIRDEKKKPDGKHSSKKNTKDKKVETTEPKDNNLKLILDKISTFDEQLKKFMIEVQPDIEIIEKDYNIVCSNLNDVLVPFFPKCQAIRFGSSVTGLQLKGSDVDIYVDINEPIIDDSAIRTMNNPQNPNIKTARSVFRTVKMVMFKQKSMFSNVIPIPTAKVPIIKFHHIQTNLDCDISFKHGLGVYNSWLIKHYLSIDSRIKPMIIILKYWGKTLELTGTGKITNYSLVMIVLFYLQQKSIGLVPTIKELQDRKVCTPIYSNGWQINFAKIKYQGTEKSSKLTIPELLCGFFEFYMNFNFKDLVICPRDGISYTKDEFKLIKAKSNGLLDNFNLSKFISIQDPIQLNRNIASSWNQRLLDAFQNCCFETYDLCSIYKLKNTNKLLPLLCDNKFKFEIKKSKIIVIKIKPEKFIDFNLSNDVEIDRNSINDMNYLENNWFLSVSALIQRIFVDILKLDVQMMNDGDDDDDSDDTATNDHKQMKFEKNSDVHTNNFIDKLTFICQSDYCLNHNRKPNRTPNLDPTLSVIDKESLISDKILKEMIQCKIIYPVNFKCLLEKKTNPLSMNITLIDRQYGNNSFLEIGNYLKHKLGTFVRNEIIHMLQYKKKIEIPF